MKGKVALVTGASGQDSAYLSKFLLDKGYKVIGGARRSAERSYWRLEKMGILDDVEIVDFDLLDYSNMYDVISKYKPDEIYNLGAMSFVGTSFRQPISTIDVDGVAVCKLLDIIKTFFPKTKIYQASTSEMFGRVREMPQNEMTPFNPVSPYGCAKLLAHNMMETYRDSYDIFACCGILFNHESALRGDEFVTKKITNYVRKFRDNKVKKPLQLGNLNAERDWGFAGDYVKAMWLMMQVSKPDTYVVGSGKKYSIRDFVEMAFHSIGIAIVWEGKGKDEIGRDTNTGNILVEVNEKFYRPNEVEVLLADPTKAYNWLKWKPEHDIADLVSMMVDDMVF
jgi:GDPmannose 4,6-dehydratase